jgi:hypothetical protein
MPKNDDVIGQKIVDSAVTHPGSVFRGIAHSIAGYSSTGRALRSATKPLSVIGRGVVKRAGPLTVAGAAIDAANLSVNTKARQAAHDGVEKDAKLNPVVRSAKAFFDPINTGYGIASQVGELINSTRDAKKSEANYQAALQKRSLKKQEIAKGSRFRLPNS